MNEPSPPITWTLGDPATLRSVEAWAATPEPRTNGGSWKVLASDERREIVSVAPPRPAAGPGEPSSGRDGNGGKPVVVKVFRTATGPHPLRDQLKRGLRHAPAQREWRALCTLHAAGVSVPLPLALGRLANGDDVLVESAVSGRDLWSRLGEEPGSASDVVVQLGQLVRRLHEAGLVHRDLHAGNVLTGPDGPVLIDLQRTRRARHSARARRRDVGLLDYSLAQRGVSPADRLRFRRAALGLAPDDDGPRARRAEAGTQIAARRIAEHHQRRRTRECTQSGGRYALAHSATARGLRLRRFAEADLQRALAAHEDALAQDDERVRKRRAHTCITEVSTPAGHLVIKETRRRGRLRRWADSFRGSPARRGWRGGQGLGVRGIPTAVPLAFLESRAPFGRRHRRSILLMERFGDFDADAEEARRRAGPEALGRALLRLVLALHRGGIHHGDLKAGNIRLREGAGKLEAGLVDLDGIRFPRRGFRWLAALSDARRRERELAQLNASLPDALLPGSLRAQLFDDYAAELPFPRWRGGNAAARRRIVRASLARAHAWQGDGCVDAGVARAPEAGLTPPA